MISPSNQWRRLRHNRFSSNSKKHFIKDFPLWKAVVCFIVSFHHQLIIIFSTICQYLLYIARGVYEKQKKMYFSFIAASNPRYHLGKSINFLWYKILLYFVAMASHTRNMKMLSSPPAYIYFVHVAAFWLLIKSFSIQYGCSILTYGILFELYHCWLLHCVEDLLTISF